MTWRPDSSTMKDDSKRSSDQIYRTVEEKFEAVVSDIQARHKSGQPVLVGNIN